MPLAANVQIRVTVTIIENLYCLFISKLSNNNNIKIFLHTNNKWYEKIAIKMLMC